MMGGVQPETLRYRADGEYQNEHGAWRWRPSIYMPRWASRITLEITDVRIERLQDISHADAKAEGITPFDRPFERGWHTEEGRHYAADPVESYALLWESINGAGSWDVNPWVWCITFRRVSA